MLNDRDSQPSSPTSALIPITPVDLDWQPIFHASNQVVLYNPTSHAISIRHSQTEAPASLCPYCNQPLPPGFETDSDIQRHTTIEGDGSPVIYGRASNYFQLLAIANETSSRPSTPPPQIPLNDSGGRGSAFSAEAMAEGYFKAFFQEECKLGMGANGSVFLCQHMLDGNPLGYFAVKKIAVGESHAYLLKILREVRLLESLNHPNIITYHHAWLESCQFSSFGPKVPTLHVLMQWAEGGSLDDFIDVRLGRSSDKPHLNSPSASFPQSSRTARIQAFRAFQRATPRDRERMRGGEGGRGGERWKAIHLLSADEVRSLFGDVVEGLAFLHDKSILHLDLKPGNVLLTWDEGKLVPRGMLSDFGTSRDMLHSSRARSGNTGTLEYTSPESLPSPHTGILRQIDSKSDMWSLGMILHKLLFFRLPYQHASDETSAEEGEKMDRLEREVLSYPGFKSTPTLVTTFETRRLPRAFLVLLESLLNIKPSGRPSCDRVSSAIREGKLDPVTQESRHTSGNFLIPIPRRSNSGSSQSPKPSVQSEDIGVDGDGGKSEHFQQEQSSLDKKDERSPLLSLPAPVPLVPSSPVKADFVIFGTRLRLRIEVRPAWLRTFKSSLLVTKVLSLSLICPCYDYRLAIVSLLLVVAVMDAWFDDMRISVFLGAVHIGVVGLMFWS